MTDLRTHKIEEAVCAGAQLIGALQQEGEVTPKQARLILEACVRACVPNFESWEVRDAAKRVEKDLTGEKHAQVGKGSS